MKINIQGQPYGAEKADTVDAGAKKFGIGISKLEKAARDHSASRAAKKAEKRAGNMGDTLQSMPSVDEQEGSVEAIEVLEDAGEPADVVGVKQEPASVSESASVSADEVQVEQIAEQVVKPTEQKVESITSIMTQEPAEQQSEPELPEGVKQKLGRRSRPKISTNRKARKVEVETQTDEDQRDTTESPERSDGFVAKFLVASVLVFGAAGAFVANMVIQVILG